MADIHGDFETFDKALQLVKASDAEVLAITGDLSGYVFDEKEEEYFINLVNNLGGLAQQIHQNTNGNGQIKTFHDCAEFLTSNNVKADEDVKKIGEDYLRFEEVAKEKMLGTYKEFRQRFDSLDQKVILVPGNWDYKHIDDVLAHENLHGKYKEEIGGIEFAGYGGALELPVALPFDLINHFDEDEAYSHLCKEDAEVVLMHTMPKGFAGNERHYGEYSMLAFLYRNTPSLILTGHNHCPCVINDEKTGTIVANPGNLGRYNSQDFGTFLELEIDENYFVCPKAMYKVNGNSVETLDLKEKVPQ